MSFKFVLFFISSKVTILLSFFEPSFLNYFISLIFLGIGWNFLFISGTSLLVTTYKPDEKFKAQGFNDLLVFSSMALASLLAGILISIVSWKTVNLFCIPFLILIIFPVQKNICTGFFIIQFYDSYSIVFFVPISHGHYLIFIISIIF